MKKLLIAIVLGGAVFASVYAMAASLGLTTDDLGAGDHVVLSCAGPGADPVGTGVNVTYTTILNPIPTVADQAGDTDPRYDLEHVVLNGLTSICHNQLVKITVLGPAGVVLAEHGQDAPLVLDGTNWTGTTFTEDFTDDEVSAEDIVHIAVVITGDQGS